MTDQPTPGSAALVDELAASRRNVYRLQVSGDKLCDALRSIASGCEEPAKVARRALDHKEPADPAPHIEQLEADNARLKAERDAAYERAAQVADDVEHFARCGSISWSAAEPEKLAIKAEAAEQIATAIRNLKGQPHVEG